MATYESLRQAIDTLIKTNGNEEITGAILNNVLNAIITALGANYQFCGEAKPSTNPGQPMQNVFYFAYDAGTYVNFGNITIPMGISTLSWDGTQWTGETIYHIDSTPILNSSNMISSGAVYNALAGIYNAIGDGKLYEGIATPSTFPTPLEGIRKFYIATQAGTYEHFFANGDITLVLPHDGLYVIYSVTGEDDDDWNYEEIFGIDGTPLLNSTSLITSGGVFDAISRVVSGSHSGKIYAGIATPSTQPQGIDNEQPIFYIATQAGTYSHFLVNYDIPLVIPHNGIWILTSSGDDDDWNAQEVIDLDATPTSGSHNLVESGGVFNELALGAVYDVSAKNPTAGPNNDGKFTSLSALLNDANLNTLIPVAFRKGGMSIKYVHTSDNKYVQYRLMTDSFNTTPNNWQGVDDEPTEDSKNLVKSGGVKKIVDDFREDGLLLDITNITTYVATEAKMALVAANNRVTFANVGNIYCKKYDIHEYAGHKINIKTILDGYRDVVCVFTEVGTLVTGQYTLLKTDVDVTIPIPVDTYYIYVNILNNNDCNIKVISEYNIREKISEVDENTVKTTENQILSTTQKANVLKNLGFGNGSVDSIPTVNSENAINSGAVAEALDKSALVKSNRKTILNTKEFINTANDKTYDLPNVTSKFGICVRLSVYNNVVVRVLEKDSNDTTVSTINLKHRGDGVFSINWDKQNSNTVKATLQIANQTGSQITIYEAWYVEGYDAFYDDVVTYVGGIDKSAALEGIVQLSTNYVPLTNYVYNPHTTNTYKKLNEQEFTVAAGTFLNVSLNGMLESDKKYNLLFKLDTDDDSSAKLYVENLTKNYAYNLGQGHYGIFDFANAISFCIDNRNNNSDVVLKWAYCTKDYVPFVLNGGIVPELINNGAVKKEKLDVDAIGYTLARGTYNLIYSGQISTNGTTSVAGKTLSDVVILESYKSIWYDFTDWVVGQKYSLITYCEDATPFVIDNNVTTNFVNCGNGIFILIDYIPVTSNVEVIITGGPSGGLHKKTLIAKNAIPLNIPAKGTIYSGTADYKDILEVDTDYNNIPTVSPRNRFKYPLYPVWGHEYLYSWYNKIDAGTADIYMAFAGDSTTEAKGRHDCAKKIMRLGGYPGNLVHSYDRGHGTMQTLQWIGEQLPSGVPVGGYLEQDMNLDETYQNPTLPSHPDLYVIAYGYNDGSPSNWPDLTVEERVAEYERRLREGLGRIRTSETFASGPSYNLSPDEMAVIICTPSSIPESNPVYGFVKRIRTVIEKACRDYHCAFVDITARQYDHTFSSSWSWTSVGPDGLHPSSVCVKDFMSMFADLIFPICYHIE